MPVSHDSPRMSNRCRFPKLFDTIHLQWQPVWGARGENELHTAVSADWDSQLEACSQKKTSELRFPTPGFWLLTASTPVKPEFDNWQGSAPISR